MLTQFNYNFCLKPGPDDSNISTQHLPTLLVQHLQAPAKRLQHLRKTDRNIIERNMLHAFGHHVAMCCDTLRVENRTSAHAQAQHRWTTSGQATTTPCNIHKCCTKNLIIFKFEPTTPNMLQHVATGWPNAETCCAQQCCVQMLGSFGRGSRLSPTEANFKNPNFAPFRIT